MADTKLKNISKIERSPSIKTASNRDPERPELKDTESPQIKDKTVSVESFQNWKIGMYFLASLCIFLGTLTFIMSGRDWTMFKYHTGKIGEDTDFRPSRILVRSPTGYEVASSIMFGFCIFNSGVLFIVGTRKLSPPFIMFGMFTIILAIIFVLLKVTLGFVEIEEIPMKQKLGGILWDLSLPLFGGLLCGIAVTVYGTYFIKKLNLLDRRTL